MHGSHDGDNDKAGVLEKIDPHYDHFSENVTIAGTVHCEALAMAFTCYPSAVIREARAPDLKGTAARDEPDPAGTDGDASSSNESRIVDLLEASVPCMLFLLSD